MGNLDCRPSHNFMIDDNGVKYCTACGEDYDNLGNKDSCSGSDWARRHNTRKPNRVEYEKNRQIGPITLFKK